MKILLDENLPVNLKKEFGFQHEVYTVIEMKWNGVKNGNLLQLMITNGFEVFVCIDKNISSQQNLSKIPIVIFVLNAFNNKIDTLKPFVKEVILQLSSHLESGVIKIDMKK